MLTKTEHNRNFCTLFAVLLIAVLPIAVLLIAVLPIAVLLIAVLPIAVLLIYRNYRYNGK